MSWIRNLALIGCCALSASVITATVSWMDANTPGYTADEALEKANLSLSRFCTQKGINREHLKLVNIHTPPAFNNHANRGKWQFDFYSPQTGLIGVKVSEPSRKLAVVKPRS
jgi:hypothetical protein